MLKSHVCDILIYSETCINPLTIVSTYHLHQGDSYSSLKVKVSEASDKAAIKKNEVTGKYKCFWVDILLYIHECQND